MRDRRELMLSTGLSVGPRRAGRDMDWGGGAHDFLVVAYRSPEYLGRSSTTGIP